MSENTQVDKITASPVVASGTQMVWPGAVGAYRHIYKQFRSNPEPGILYIIVFSVLAIAGAVIDGQTTLSLNSDRGIFNPEDLASLAFLAALPTYGLALADGRKITIAQFMNITVAKYFMIVFVSILYIGIIILSLMLLVVPAVWTIAWFSVAVFPILVKGLDPIEALKESKRITKGHLSTFWGLSLFTVLVAFVATLISTLPYGIGNIATAFVGIFSSGTLALLYRYLQSASRTAISPKNI